MQRTTTTHLQSFSLPLPNAVTFNFTDTTLIEVSIPPGSKWKTPIHWHIQTPDLQWLRCDAGQLYVSSIERSVLVGGGTSVGSSPKTWSHFPLDERFGWGPLERDNLGVNSLFSRATMKADSVLHRNICSAILDRDLFPRLHSTPLWFQVLYKLAVRASWKRRLLDASLRAQLQVIYYEHDYHVWHGSIPFTLPWELTLSDLPDWAARWELRSIYVVSGVVMFCCYWVGKLFLGMKGEYAEYTPSGLDACHNTHDD